MYEYILIYIIEILHVLIIISNVLISIFLPKRCLKYVLLLLILLFLHWKTNDGMCILTQLSANLRKKIDPNLVYSWKEKLSPIDQFLSHQIAGNLFEELHYPKGTTQVNFIRAKFRFIYHLLIEFILWFLQGLCARVKSINKSKL